MSNNKITRAPQPAQAPSVPAATIIGMAEAWEMNAAESRDQGWHTQADAFDTCAADARRAVKLAAPSTQAEPTACPHTGQCHPGFCPCSDAKRQAEQKGGE